VIGGYPLRDPKIRWATNFWSNSGLNTTTAVNSHPIPGHCC